MRNLHVILCILVLSGICIYIYQFHEDKYRSVVSYVAESASSLKEKVGTHYKGPTVTLAATLPHLIRSQDTVLSDIVNQVMRTGNKNDSEELVRFTDQVEWGKRRSLKCLEAAKIPLSEYGSHIRGISLSYFTKFDSNYKFLYCSVPKVASTNWKRTMIVLTMNKETRDGMTKDDVNALKNVHNDPRIQALTSVESSPLEPPYSNYYKFVVFRHPFTRMVSAWRNKLQLVDGNINKYFYKNYGIPIIKLTRGPQAEMQFLKNQNANLVTFQEFVIGIKNGIVDRHWMPQSEICQPCAVNYNHVGFFEYLNDDTNHILDQIGVKDEIVKADVVSPAGQTKSTTAVTQELFNALSQEDIDAMFEFYKLDFVLFGYEKDVNSPSFPYPSIPERQG
ncbi:hypothetical protein ACHWQZ_G015919 [Mnemiopsis leidyi]